MKYTEHALNVLTAQTYKGVGKAWVCKYLCGVLAIEKIVELLNQTLKQVDTTVDVFCHRKERIRSQLDASWEVMDGLVALGDDDFPEHRGQVKNSQRPVHLFYKGDLSLLSRTRLNIAVIGLLEPDMNTILKEKKLVNELVQRDAVIVSGLANGCDAVAHAQCLESGGKTVAILPSILSQIMPSSNKGLAERILVQGGLLVTEYLNEAPSKRAFIGRYQERDRLQALFSDGIILASSYAKNDLGNDSGARLAMGYAYEYNLPRAVMYDETEDANNPKYDLNRQLMDDDVDVIVVSQESQHEKLKLLIEFKNCHNCSEQKDLF